MERIDRMGKAVLHFRMRNGLPWMRDGLACRSCAAVDDVDPRVADSARSRGGGLQPGMLFRREREPFADQRKRLAMRRLAPAAFQRPDRIQTNPGALGQGLLRETFSNPELTQQLPERQTPARCTRCQEESPMLTFRGFGQASHGPASSGHPGGWVSRNKESGASTYLEAPPSYFLRVCRGQARSKRSRFMTFVHAATKLLTNSASSQA